MISFICSSKYSSSILANRGGERSTKMGWACVCIDEAQKTYRRCLRIVPSYVSGSRISLFYKCHFILSPRFTKNYHLATFA